MNLLGEIETSHPLTARKMYSKGKCGKQNSYSICFDLTFNNNEIGENRLLIFIFGTYQVNKFVMFCTYTLTVILYPL